MRQLQIAYDHDDGGNVLRGLAYVAFQELATRISHRNTGRYSADPVADRIMARIAADENLHMVFYRDMLFEAMAIDPSAAVCAIADEIEAFQMPGAGMEGFTRKAAQMARAGIYDLRIHHDEVIWPLLRHWGVFEAERPVPGGRGCGARTCAARWPSWMPPRRASRPAARGRWSGRPAEADPPRRASAVGLRRHRSCPHTAPHDRRPRLARARGPLEP